MSAEDLNKVTQRILLIGDIDKAFLDPGAVTSKSCEVCVDISDAIGAASDKSFAAIGIVLSSQMSGLISTLEALRNANVDAKIILLPQMYEEPIAKKLVGSSCNGRGMADDYLICPVRLNHFYQCIDETIETRETTVDADTERRIRLLEKLATTDELTGLKNRRYMWEFSRQIIEYAKQRNGRVTLLVFDIDDFKQYNDIYGHSVGDELLKQAAVLMQRCCRTHDVVGRIGGDEFAVVFWDDPKQGSGEVETERRSTELEHPQQAIFIAKRFRKELEKAELHLLGPAGKGVLAISGGLASFPRNGSTIQELFDKADEALLEAKRSGKNRIYLVGKPQNDIGNLDD